METFKSFLRDLSIGPQKTPHERRLVEFAQGFRRLSTKFVQPDPKIFHRTEPSARAQKHDRGRRCNKSPQGAWMIVAVRGQVGAARSRSVASSETVWARSFAMVSGACLRRILASLDIA